METKKNIMGYLIFKCLFFMTFVQNLYGQTDAFLTKLDSQSIVNILPKSTTIIEETSYNIFVKINDFEGFKVVLVEWNPHYCTNLEADFLIFKAEKSGFRCLYFERNSGYDIGDIPIYEYYLRNKKLVLYTYIRTGTTEKELDLSELPKKNAIKIIDENPKKWVIVVSNDQNEENARFELEKAKKLNKNYITWILKDKNHFRTFIEFSKKEDTAKNLSFIQKTFPKAYIKDANLFCSFVYHYEEIVECKK